MPADEFDTLLARVRPPEEPADPMERAAAAMRRSRGLDRPRKATKEQAAAALRQYHD
ncbi:hypothetical protein MB901379_00486 [Mycobacterium basiliense]|uniref:Uncharacterized protein n=1 Tax=Mycobacterium basiliense TaxID=2094119 RepID=A0A3S4CSP3_9MYCO|nr:hypothetical protein [Mycobacterium basiliense]VDM86957.1 hypothetical protein MB901379_00486 [Mycobacterium basiliense]